jgi:hypothetical protein
MPSVVRVLAMLGLFASPLLAPSAASSATATTVVPLACFLGDDVFPATITLRSSLPDRVQQGTTFVFDVTARDFFKIAAPYSGTITLHERFSVSAGATPSGDFVLSNGPHHFDTGDIESGLGTLHVEFTASGAVGSMIELSFHEFSYRITPDSGTSFTSNCVVDAPFSPVIGRTIITAPLARTTADCANGGWQRVTDDQGRAFKNHGQCVSFVVTAAEVTDTKVPGLMGSRVR